MRHGNVGVQMQEMENCIRGLRQQLDQKQVDLDRALVVVAGLECVLSEIAKRDEDRQYESCPDCFHHCSKENGCKSMRFSSTGALANGAIIGKSGDATILRKQAEAVIEFGYLYGPESIVRMNTQSFATRLRQQADQLEKGDGQNM